MTNSKSRRQFLKQTISLGGGVLLMGSPLANSFASSTTLSSQGYKALICLDLNGGNDGTNTIVPLSETEYTAYKGLRDNLAIAKSKLLAINHQSFLSSDGVTEVTYGLHPSLTALQALFNQGNAAVLANVGTKINEFGVVGTPPKRASHSNQRQLWQGLDPKNMAVNKQGWMGRIGDLDRFNHTMSSVSGKNLWQTGEMSVPYVMSEQGPIGFNEHADSAMESLMDELAGDAMASEHVLTSEYAVSDQAAEIMSQTMVDTLNSDDINGKVNSLVKAYPEKFDPEKENPELTRPFPNTKLGQGFETILRNILAHEALGMQRQSFYIGRGGFDFHANHLERQASLLKEVNDAVEAFQSALEQLSITDYPNLVNQVTTFTSSDFGRTTTGNGTGTAHGWGNHHFIIGGAVNGQHIYGTMPEMKLGGQGMLDNKGILEPSTAMEQYAATLARWFGVQGSLNTVFPYLDQFAVHDLGFMQA